jgi:hypothetical protein
MLKETVKNNGMMFDPQSSFIWPTYDQEVANEEGWCLSVCDKKYFDIQYLNDFEAEGGDLKQALGTDDCSVCAGVVRRAMEGSRPHMLAAYLDGRLFHTGEPIWVPNSLIHPTILPNLQRNYKAYAGATMSPEQIEKLWRIADNTKKQFRFLKDRDCWCWYDRDSADNPDASHGPFKTIIEALVDATEPYVNNEGT